MKLRRPAVLRQIISVVVSGREARICHRGLAGGGALPAKVVAMIMDTWTPTAVG